VVAQAEQAALAQLLLWQGKAVVLVLHIVVVDSVALVVVKVAAEALKLLLVLRGFVVAAVVVAPALLLVLGNFLEVAVGRERLVLII
jgi:hypothetical protein